MPVVPASQAHTLATEPILTEDLPVSHTVHASDPDSVLKVPTPHGSHVPAPSDPVVPASQVHTFETEPDTSENFPTAHPVQEAAPGSVLYVPKAQDSQVPNPSDPVDPALQVHSFVIEPVTAENFPVPHPVHNAEPGIVL